FYTHENHDFDLHLGSNIIALNAFSDYGQVVAAIINSPTNFFELRALKRIVKTKKLIAILALEKNVHEMLIKKLPSLKSKIFFVEEGSYLKVSKQVLDYAFNLQREQITKNL
ncbi:MAG TPA: hypothetical protein VHM20_06390, partial [Gammaproteobacteria bacterium]|nr:hypothetical protein [Gammaproteobacteria bacterium]